ncbi:ubiquitin carboxyl-terminal hydrolase 36 isoform X1 [Lucilia cuprina]|uniref:ubiquitin carboxyl-terminal hydrolase 36 isoform X1 n=1 Tax=Lucilia cuprina TaxID=7375 RepID=UPI001F0530C3|nr:ubiquitin carboxyl-terminal hydrolase 36 isoform X1 [Lucilia cuprina]
MPVSVVCETAASVNAALRESLGSGVSCSAAAKQQQSTTSSSSSASSQQQDDKMNGGSNVDDIDTLHGKLVASAKRVLLSKIDYEEVTNYGQSVLDSLKSKYIVLKPSSANNNSMENGRNSPATCNNNGANGDSAAGKYANGNANGGGAGTPNKKAPNPNELPAPKRILYPRENVRVGWKATGRKWDVGVGMMNVGNTCYLNSTLQAIFHVPSMANWLMSDSAHMERCESTDAGCIICAMAKTLHESQKSQSAIRPYYVYSKLKSICKHLVMGRQEDAHEFLRYLVEAMEKSYLSRFRNYKELDQYSKETTPLNQILGGYLKSSVRCLSCNHVSVTFQHFQDLLLDIRKADTVDEALEGYFSRERLEDMGYKCEACKKKVSATKQFSLERAPIALCIQLKRFSMLGTKLNKQITIKPRLDLTKYASRKNPGEQLTYRLVAMVTHLGASQHCGHYTAIGLTESGTYYNYDDSYVRPISMQNVCNTNAYIIFYEMDTQPPRNVTSTQVSGAQSTSVASSANQKETIKMNGHALGGSPRIIGPQLPPGYNTNGTGSVTSSSTPLTNGGSKLLLNRSASIPSATTTSTSSSNGGSSKIMIHFKNNNNTSSTVKTSAATSSVTCASATSSTSSSTFDNLKNSSNNNNNSNGLHLVGTGKFQESTTNTKYPLGVSTTKRQVNNLKNSNESSSDDDDENEIVSSSTSSQQTHNATQATLPSMPKLGVESTNTTSLTNGYAKKSPAPIKSLVPYGSETDEEADVCMSATTATSAAATTASNEQQKRLLPNPLKRRQSSSSWSSSSSSDNDDDANDNDVKPSNGIKIKKAASSTATISKSPAKSANEVAKKSSDTIDEIFNSIKRSNNTNNTNNSTTSSGGNATLKKKSQNQQFTVTSTTTTTDSSSSESDDCSGSNNKTKPTFKRSHSTPPSPPVVKTNSGIWQVTSLQPVTACISPTATMPSSSGLSLPAASTEIKSPKNHKNPFATKPLPVATDNAKRLKKDATNKTFNGNGYQRNTAANEAAVSELLKQSHRGYGAPTLNWNGQQSEIDKENFYLFDEKRIEDDDDDDNDDSNINNNKQQEQQQNINNQNKHDLKHDDNDGDDDDDELYNNVKEISNFKQNNTQQHHQQNEQNSDNNISNFVATEQDIEMYATIENSKQNQEQTNNNKNSNTTPISFGMDDIEHKLTAQDILKHNEHIVQQMMDEEMENLDSCSSGTTATTVINTYSLSSPNSSLLTTISPPATPTTTSNSRTIINRNTNCTTSLLSTNEEVDEEISAFIYNEEDTLEDNL